MIKPTNFGGKFASKSSNQQNFPLNRQIGLWIESIYTNTYLFKKMRWKYFHKNIACLLQMPMQTMCGIYAVMDGVQCLLGNYSCYGLFAIIHRAGRSILAVHLAFINTGVLPAIYYLCERNVLRNFYFLNFYFFYFLLPVGQPVVFCMYICITLLKYVQFW